MAKKKTFTIWLAALAVPVILTALLFSAHPRYPTPEMTADDWVFHSRIIMRELPRLRKARPEEVFTLKLYPNEVNALLRLAANGEKLLALSGVIPVRSYNDMGYHDYQANYRKGQFTAEYALSAVNPMVFGGHIRLRITASADYRNGKITVTPVSASAGAYPVPLPLVRKLISAKQPSLENRQEVRIFKSIVRSVIINPDNTVEIKYYPYKLNQLLKF